MTGLISDNKKADLPTRHYGASYQSKIPSELLRHIPTGLYHFDVTPSYRKKDDRSLPLRRLTVQADNEFIARRDAHEKAKLGAWESLWLRAVEPNPAHVELQSALAKYI